MDRTLLLRRTAALSALLALLLWGAHPSTGFEWPQWRARIGLSNPLVGTVVDSAGKVRTMADVEAAAASAGYVLIGETHDNPDHHRLQATLLGAMIGAGRRPAVVFEMIPAAMRERLDHFLAGEQPDARALGRLLDWSERGWPDWSIYQPIAEAAIDAGLPIRPGDLDAESIRKIGREGASALTERERKRLGLDVPLEKTVEEELAETIREAHCGLMPDAAIAPMMDVQRARDGALADALIAAARDADGAVLIAGAGHLQAERAVPALIRARKPEASVLAIGLVEVVEGALPSDGAKEVAAYDFTIFTPPADDVDHCAALRDTLRGR